MTHFAFTHGLLFSAMVLIAIPGAAAPAPRPTDDFRKEHATIKEHLRHLEEKVGVMSRSDADAQQKTAAFVVAFLNDHIRSHAKWEEARLYPLVDQRTHAGLHPFTSSMRYEHGIIGRSIDELEKMSAARPFDVTAFIRRSDRLFGVIAAHFEKEEEVFLPILDKTMTREELKKELGPGDPHVQ